jgi:hypothetical protein
MTDATKATPLSADIQPKIGEYTSPGVQTPPPAIPQDELTGKTHHPHVTGLAISVQQHHRWTRAADTHIKFRAVRRDL